MSTFLRIGADGQAIALGLMQNFKLVKRNLCLTPFCKRYNNSLQSTPVFFTGVPTQLSQEALNRCLAAAADGLNLERERTGFSAAKDPTLFSNPVGHADPAVWQAMTPSGFGSVTPQLDSSMADWLRLKFPALKSLPTVIAGRLDLGTLLQLNDALVRDSKAFKKLEPDAKLAQNVELCASTPTVVIEGLDNRKSTLHEARFLGGAACSAQTIWLKARELLGNEGVPALGGYDMDAVGCGGSVTPKGWLELHNPASTNVSLKMFHMANVSSVGISSKKLADQDKENSSGDSLREICDLEDFKSAMFALREAMAMALPWNKTISAIQGFLNITNYCRSDLEGHGNRAAILTAFVNYVLGRNALNWQNKQHFISTNEMLHVWTTWYGQQPVSVLQPRKQTQQQQTSKGRGDKSDICRRFNSGTCPTKGAECRTFYGKTLRHLCNAVTSSGKTCGLPHPRMDHK